MLTLEETIFVNRDNYAEIKVINGQDDQPVDFAGATRMVLSFAESDEVVDTDVNSGAIDWAQGLGVIRFKLGGLSLPVGERAARLVVYDPGHTNGQVVVHEGGLSTLKMTFSDV